MREIESARTHLVCLRRHRAPEQPDPCAHRSRVGRRTYQTHGNARCTRIIAQHQRRRPEAVHHHIEIPVPIEIGRRERVRDVLLGAEPPRAARQLERQVAAISERHVAQRQRRELPPKPTPRDLVEPILQSLLHIGVHDVPQMPVRDQDVLPAVEVHVEEHRAPRPSARLHAGRHPHLGEGAVPTIHEQHVPLLLQLRLGVAGHLGQCRVRGDLRLQPMRVVGEHVHHEEVGTSVAIHIPDVDAHRGVAHLPARGPVGEPEVTTPIVHPERVDVLEVVRDVEVGCAVAVQIAERRAECERLRLVSDHATGRGAEPPRDE